MILTRKKSSEIGEDGSPLNTELETAYLNRYVTDEQRSRRPIFIATLWAGAS